MVVSSFDVYLNRILKDIEYRKNVDYESRMSVRKFNAAYKRIINNISMIEMHYPEQKPTFLDMLTHEDNAVAYNIAWLILQRPFFTLDEKRCALNVIKTLYYEKKLEHLIDKAILHLIIPEWDERLNGTGDAPLS